MSGFQNTVYQIFLALLMTANIAITKLIDSIFLVKLAKYANYFVPHYLTFLPSCYFLSHPFKYYCLHHVLEKNFRAIHILANKILKTHPSTESSEQPITHTFLAFEISYLPLLINFDSSSILVVAPKLFYPCTGFVFI